ncbi:hypothetical protein Btru_059233 [Bulinus truncatus]|nr:hypothetical protein Btru_059233 [Bulinus truncatus]
MNATDTGEIHEGPRPLPLDPFVTDFFSVFNVLICSELIGFVGIAGNIINIRNFYKQGFGDSVTVTLAALAVSDLGALITQQGYNILINPWLTRMDLDFNLYDMVAVFFFYPNGYFIRVSGMITTFAAFERCVSVTLPLKVRFIFTRKVALVVNISIFAGISLYLYPLYYVYCVEFVYLFNPATNRTIFTLVYRNNADYVLHVSYLFIDLVLPYFTFLVTVVCTIIITVQLKTTAQWRTSVSSGGRAARENAASSREKKTAAMLVAVSSDLHRVPRPSLRPYSTALQHRPRAEDGGVYFNIAFLCYTFTFLLETINCTVSFIVYYRMSSRPEAGSTSSLASLVFISLPGIGFS